MKTFHEFESKEYGIKAIVFKHVNGIAVQVKDTDADMFVPIIKIFPEMEDAVEYAQVCVGQF